MARCVHKQPYGGRNEDTPFNLLRRRRPSGAPGPRNKRQMQNINPNNGRMLGYLHARASICEQSRHFGGFIDMQHYYKGFQMSNDIKLLSREWAGRTMLNWAKK